MEGFHQAFCLYCMDEQRLFARLDDAYAQQCGDLATRLEKILEGAPSGRLPDEAEEHDLYKSLHRLRKTRLQYEEEARKVLGDEITPAPGASLSELRDALSVHWRSQHKDKLRTVLEQFIQVSSNQPRYQEYLAPLQDSAREAIALLDKSETRPEQIAGDAAGPRLFLQALRMDPRSPEGAAFLEEKLTEYYSADIRIGFFVGAYEVPEEILRTVQDQPPTADGPADLPAEAGAAPDANDVPAQLAVCEEQSGSVPHDEAAEKGTGSNPVPSTPQAAEATDSSAAPAAARSRNAQPAAEQSAPTGESRFQKKSGVLLNAVNKPRLGASASTFKKGLRSIGPAFRDLPSLLHLMGSTGAASAGTLCALGRHAGVFSNYEDSDVLAALDILARKGWAAQFTYELDGQQKTVYGLSEFCAASMRKESIANFLRRISLLQGHHSLGYGPREDRDVVMRTAEDADALLYLLDNCEDGIREAAFRYDKPTVSWVTVGEHFQYSCVTVPQRSGHPARPTQLVHSHSDPDLLCLYDVLYVQRPGEAPPDDRWRQAVRGGFIVFRDGEYEIIAGTDDKDAQDAGAPENAAETGSSGKAGTDEAAVRPAGTPAAVASVIQRTISGRKKSLPSPWQKPAAAAESFQTALHDPAAVLRRNSAHRTIHLETETNTGAAAKKGALAAVLDAAPAGETPDDETLTGAVLELVHASVPEQNKNRLDAAANAVLLAKSGAVLADHEECRALSHQLQLATGMHIDELTHSAQELDAAFPDPSSADPALLYAAYALALLNPSAPGDYLLRARARDLFAHYEDMFPKLPEFKGLFRTLLDLWDKTTSGFSPSVMALLGDNSDKESYVEQLTRTAKDLMHVVSPTTLLKPLVPTHNAAFGPGSDLYGCMNIISRDVRHKRAQVERVLAAFCDPEKPDAFVVDEARIHEDLAKKWDRATAGKFGALEYIAKDKETRCYKQRLELMVAWVRHIRTLESWSREMGPLKKMRDKLLRDLDQLERKPSWQCKPSETIMRNLAARIRAHLENRSEEIRTFAVLLKTGRFWLDEHGRPEFDEELSRVPFYEPWRRTALHLRIMDERPDLTYEQACAEILDEAPSGSEGPDAQSGADGLMDNLFQLESMRRILESDAPDFEISDDLRDATRDAAEESQRELEQELDIAYALGQVNLDGKKQILETMQKFEPLFFDKGDFAAWRWFLKALSQQITASADRRAEVCQARIDAIRADGSSSALLELAEKELSEYKNLTIAEEYINHHENGDFEWRPTDGACTGSGYYFEDFRTPEVFQPLLEECRRNGEGRGTSSLKSFGTQYVQNHRPADWTVRHTGDSAAFLQAWPGGKGTLPEQVSSFLNSLGIEATETVLKRQKGNVEVFEAKVSAVPTGKKDYAHPIAAFGTRMEPTLRVIAVYGKCIEEQLVETMRELDYDDISIVLLDYHMDLGQRRRLAEIFHRQTQGQNRYLVVDRVLALYLAFRTRTERLKAMLQCTLPYTACQPFGSDGGATPDEMFCGREKELASIMSPGGASIVYGGRQLGKTALLQRAQNRFHSPAKHRYAAYANIQSCDTEEKLARKLIQNIRAEAGDAVRLRDTASLDELCLQLREAFNSKRISSLLLLMDEADVFLKSIDKDQYAQLQPMVELRQVTGGRFKFVFAGLHNVCRAERAMANNGVFGQLGTPLCIRPLSSSEASRLLRRPLRYLGFDIPDRQLETLITNSNFYPGVLQFIGYMLVETLPEHYKKAYYSAVNNPPFGLDDELLGTVLKSRDLNASIQSKVRATLELDERYFMIARAIALLSYLDEDAQAKGYTVQAIMETTGDYGVQCLADETARTVSTLLDEMVDMGLLISSDNVRYRFRRDTFKDIVGTDADVLEEALRGKAAAQ